MIKFSIIIPICNASKSIEKLIDSILNQNFSSYEVLMVDDGSTDETVNIIQNKVGHDERFKIVRQKNKGVSSARNHGLDLAKGEIITFIDSDDYVKDSYLCKLYEIFEKKKAEIVFIEFVRKDERGNIISNYSLPDEIPKDFYDLLVFLSEQDIFGYTWSKAIRREIIGKIRFNENVNLYEDEIFTCRVIRNAKRIEFCHNVLYNYIKYKYSNSLTKRTYEDFPIYCDYVYKEWKSLIPNKLYNVFLIEKANKMAKNCKWHLLDHNVNINRYIKKMSLCCFLKDCTNQDKFIVWLKQAKLNKAKIYCILFKIKSYMKQNIKERYERT